MLTPEQIAALRDAFEQIADPVSDYLIRDIARRVSESGQLTSTAAYEVWRAQQLGISQREVKKRLRKLLGVPHRELRRLLTQAAEVGYDFDIKHLPYVQALPFERNPVMQQIVSAAVELAQDDFTNLTQTLGMVDPFGNALPLQDVYRACTDFAFKQVFTGAADYNTAVRQATANLAKYGVRVIDYESGVHTGMEAAVRRNIMGGLGLMQEQIAQHNHDALGANGWEISAHAASAPDHEPIQGRQYSDAEYESLNNSLVRRIGTLNCGHAAFPIIFGVSNPMYTEEQLRKFRTDNAAGVDYQGRHYSMYEATQQQRKIERAIRAQKRRIQVAEGTGDQDRLTTAQIRLTRLNDEYRRFSKAAGLRTQRERAEVAGFGRAQAVAARRWSGQQSAATDAARNTGKRVVFSDKATYRVSVQRYTAKANEALSAASKEVARFGSQDNREHLCLVDLGKARIAYREVGDENAVGYEGFWRHLREHESSQFAFVHNHNTDGWLSEQDMQTLLTNPNIDAMIAVRADGVIYVAPKDAGAKINRPLQMLYDSEVKELRKRAQEDDHFVLSVEREKMIVSNAIRDYAKEYAEYDTRE